MSMLRRAALALAAFSLIGLHIQAPAQSAWPAKPVRMIVPFPAGGGTDAIARELTNTLSGAGYTFVMENKPGSGGNLGVDAAAKAAPDGYTFVLGQTSNLAINPTLYSKLPYDPRQDLTPVSLVASSPLALVVAADSPIKTLGDLIKVARAKPGSINYATSGNGTVAHLTAELLQKEAGIQMTHVPYKGASQGATDVIGGLVQVYVSSIPTLVGYIRNGKMRAIAVTSAKRADDLPQVPTVAESGYPGFESVTWFGVLGPAKLPQDVVTKLNADIQKALQNPKLRERLSSQGAELSGSTAEQFGQLIDDEIKRWNPIVKASGARVD